MMYQAASKTNLKILSETCDIEGHKKRNKIEFSDGRIMCPACWKEEQEKIEQEKYKDLLPRRRKNKMHSYLSNNSIISDKTLFNSGFRNYRTDGEPEAAENLVKMAEIVKRYQKGEVFNTWLMGKPGVGKSHLSMAALINLNETSQSGSKCLFINVSSMLRKIRGGFGRSRNSEPYKYTENYFIELMGEVDFLVIDDVGSESGRVGTDKEATDFVHRVFYDMADIRQSKPTIYTTNLDWDELEHVYDEKIVSRMKMNLETISFEETRDKRIGF